MRDVEGLPAPDTRLHPVGGLSSDRGQNQLRALRHFGLRPDSHILEVGCGVGRLAYELAPYLDEPGRYTGFDISPKAIRWLEENYAPRLPNFQFDLVDARNARYRPRRGADAESIRFPYGDRSFDLACAFAVFMHMKLPEIARYLEELARVMTPDAHCLVTFRAVREGTPPPRTRGRDWVPVGDGVYTIFPETPGRALVYDDRVIRSTIEQAGMRIVTSVIGRWHGTANREASDPPALGGDLYVVQSLPPR